MLLLTLRRLTLFIPLFRPREEVAGSWNVVNTVVPSLLVLLVPPRIWPGRCSLLGTTYTGSDAPALESDCLFRTNFLGKLYVVSSVVPSFVMVGGRTDDSDGRSSTWMIFTGSDAAMMEERERSAFATGLAEEKLMQRMAKKTALESRGLWNGDISIDGLTDSRTVEQKIEDNAVLLETKSLETVNLKTKRSNS